ncbi:hypothetical protein MCRY_18225 [Marivita cryptomonadis]|nr:hypothetical protein MCRY_18225 [Marivita cryptomonadis]
MEPIEGDGRFRQMPTHACDIGLAHVDAGRCDEIRVTAMLPEVFGECPDRVRVATLTGKEQPANVQVMEQGDVIVAPPRCRLVDPDSRYIAEVLLSARRGNVVLEHTPYPVVSDIEQISDGFYRHLPGERDHEGVEQLAEPAAAARPGDRHLSGLPALTAGDARYGGMDESLVLKKAQVFPGPRPRVVHRLIRRTARRAGKPAPRFEAHIEVDLLEIGVETHVRDTPRGPKAKRHCEQARLGSHRSSVSGLHAPTVPSRGP